MFFIGRLKCLVLTHGESLFSAVKEGYKRVDMADPEEFVKGLIGQALYLVGAPPDAIKQTMDQIQEITFAKATDRRVQGSMNDMIKIYKYQRDDRNPRRLDYPSAISQMNRIPMKVLKYEYPAEVFMRGLGFSDFKIQE